jgi:hypothetical protein
VRAGAGRRLAAAILAAAATASHVFGGPGGDAGHAGEKLLASAPLAAAPDCARDGRRLQRQPACAFGRNVYLVAWCDGTRQVEKPTADIYCARVEARTGRALDPAGIVVCKAADLQEAPAVAFDGSGFLVVWQDLRGGQDYDIYAARVSEDGKVLDPGGFPVVRRAANQARPAAAFAGGSFIVAWMDARQYPVYGLYAARVSRDGKVLDADGRALDAEDADRIAKATPPGRSWLGEHHYWWDRLSSRFQPAMASNGSSCLVTYLRDVHANQTTGHALLLDPDRCAVIGSPVKLSGEPRDRVAACATPGGWAVAFDHWVSGWSPTPRLAALRLEPSAAPRDTIPRRPEARGQAPPTPMLLDLQEALAAGGGQYQQGKGHFTFWQAATAWNGRHVVVAMDYGWRTHRKVNELNYAIVAVRFDSRDGRFVDARPMVLASGSTAAGTCVRNPALAAGAAGEVLAVYEADAGIDRLTVEARLLRAGRAPAR